MKFPYIPGLLRGRFINWFLNYRNELNFVIYFFCIYWVDHMVFLLFSVNGLNYTYWCLDVNPMLLSWDKPKLLPEFSGLKITNFIFSQYLSVKNPAWLSKVPVSQGLSSGCSQSVSWGCSFIWRLNWGQNHASKFT